MPRYTYTAKASPVKTVKGDIEAESAQDVVNRLSKMGYFPVEIKPQAGVSVKSGIAAGRQALARFHLAIFTRQLSTLVDSGVNIINSLVIISNQDAYRHWRGVLADVIARIKDGRSLSESLAGHPRIFSGLYTSMIHSGEIGGSLAQVLKRLADFLEKEDEFRDSLRAALTYPLFVLAVGAMTVVVLLVFVIPRLVAMFEDMGQALPLPTLILIKTSAFLQSYWWLVIFVTGLLVFILRRFYLNPQGRLFWDRAKLKLFLLGDITLKTQISRVTRTLSLLLSSGIQMLSALETSLSVLDNRFLRLEVEKFKEKIKSGTGLSVCFRDSRIFPEFVTNIVAVGEETGTLEKSLLRVAEDYEREINRLLKTMMRLLEPVIILFIGLVVGFIVLSMLLPIFQINLIAR